MTFLIFLFAAVVLLALLLKEVCGLRRMVRELDVHARNRAASMDSAFTDWFRTLEGASMDIRKLLEQQQDFRQKEMKKSLDEISRAVLQSAETASETDARLSRAMEEGVMNLMNYAAGKASGGMEIGLG